MQKDANRVNREFIRKAFVMSVNPDKHEEYQRRHDLIWPELQSLLKLHGAHHYSIFLDKGNSQLFGYVEIEDEERWQAIASTELCQKWWAYMADIMQTNEDVSPETTTLNEVFHLD
ncbi:L-rhamnose mutarotase [Colwellia demingiae]|uniref:L-rhamnose mutarotase n=1 Tax=Colwellia demingiae TaxID=89401 RepID=A0A5C6QCT2_9GAMM|nr:L-rhamnose mutarotase [Colwellia demingiae]TWX66885.1 L-rhamnose mutarotase [Colwellia demingiae]